MLIIKLAKSPRGRIYGHTEMTGINSRTLRFIKKTCYRVIPTHRQGKKSAPKPRNSKVIYISKTKT